MYRFFSKKRNRLLVIWLSGLILLFIFIPSFFLNVKNFSIAVISFPIKLYSKTGGYFHSKKDLYEKNTFLTDKVKQLSLHIERFKELRDENIRLRKLLNFKENIKFDTISAEVIARDPSKWMASFMIDKGVVDGVLKDSAVCSADGLLGKVIEPGQQTSSVMLITHPSFRAGGILKKARINAIVMGAGNGIVKMLYLPIDAEVKKGDIVTTSEYSKIFPKGITIGTIEFAGKSKNGLYKYAIIKPSANPFDQEEVLCIK
ncbi:MAG: rod shape-determining protein MreC [Candidatus Omnitrophota bacterium]